MEPFILKVCFTICGCWKPPFPYSCPTFLSPPGIFSIIWFTSSHFSHTILHRAVHHTISWSPLILPSPWRRFLSLPTRLLSHLWETSVNVNVLLTCIHALLSCLQAWISSEVNRTLCHVKDYQEVKTHRVVCSDNFFFFGGEGDGVSSYVYCVTPSIS